MMSHGFIDLKISALLTNNVTTARPITSTSSLHQLTVFSSCSSLDLLSITLTLWRFEVDPLLPPPSLLVKSTVAQVTQCYGVRLCASLDILSLLTYIYSSADTSVIYIYL